MREKLKKLILDLGFIGQFSFDDFKSRYSGSVLGAIWAFLQPVITIVLYWFVFQLGFRSQPVSDFPFILWLLSGLVPWFFISDAISNATGCLAEYSYLVKKVLFNIDILPLAKVLSVLFVHIFLLLFSVILFMLFGYSPDIYYLQIFVYLIYIFIIVCGLSYFTATLYVFFKDTMQLVSVVMQVFFWTTPIVWDLGIMPEKLQVVLKYNPWFYVISGYRDVFIEKEWFWENDIIMSVYYWSFAVILLIIGLRIFHKCKDHFADVL